MNFQTSTDAELIQRFTGADDDSAYAELVRRHAAMVFRICRRMAGNAHDAEDASQKVFAKFAQCAGELVHHRSVAGWLYSAAWHIATSERRAAARRRRREHRIAAMHDGQTLTIQHERNELQFELYRALEMLPPDYRTAIVLHHLEGLGIAEIARIADAPIGTIAARVSRGRAMLRERLAKRDIAFSSAMLIKALDDESQDNIAAFETPCAGAFEVPINSNWTHSAGVAKSAIGSTAYFAPISTTGFFENSLHVAGAVLKGWPARTAAAVVVMCAASTAPGARQFADRARTWIAHHAFAKPPVAIVLNPKPAEPKKTLKDRADGMLDPLELSGGWGAGGGGSSRRSDVPEPSTSLVIGLLTFGGFLRRRAR